MITENYQQVMEEVQRAAGAAGRDPASIRLVTVTKGHSPEAIREAVQAGARWLGENYVDEALSKQLELADLAGLEWHMIGHVQSRKAEPVSQSFSMLHSLDSLKLAQRLERFSAAAGRVLPVLLECNVSGEASKHGWPAWDEAAWEALLPALRQIGDLPHLQVRGLMTMAPYSDNPEHSRPFFQRLRRLAGTLQDALPGLDFAELSMGMSGDYSVAIQEGATILRIGTAIMGLRSCAIAPAIAPAPSPRGDRPATSVN